MILFPWTEQANRIFFIVLIGQFILALAIAGPTGTWVEAIVIGGLILAFPLFLIKTMPAASTTRYSVAIAVQLLTALHIQQTSGLTEMHFEIFSLLAFLSIYRDWKVILVSTIVVAIHHVLFFALQKNGVAVFAFEEGHVTFGFLAIHAIFAVIEGAVLMYVARSIEKEAKSGYYLSHQISDVLQKDGKFNLTVELQETSQELVDFKKLMESFSSLINNAKQSSNDAIELSGSVSDSTSNICGLVSQNTEQVNSIATAIEEMSVTNDDVTERAVASTEISSNASSGVTHAKNTIENVSQEIKQLNTELNDASETISRLSTMCNDIDSAMSAIKSISEQTNLLALNAAIESARAGEHGRGFAVVADEVRQLSIRTGENAEEITKITSLLISEAASSVQKVNGCVQLVEESVNLSNDAGEKTSSVYEDMQTLDSNIEMVATASEEQTTVSRSIAESSQILLTASQEQAVQVEKSADKVQSLQSNIRQLNNELGKFIT